MRLPLLPPASLSPDQKDLYGDMVDVIDKNFGELVARRKDGALIGPFNGWLHFPQFGKPAWLFNRAMWEHSGCHAQRVRRVGAWPRGAPD